MPTEQLEQAPAQQGSVTGLRPLRLALVGCGAISQQMHLPVLAGHEGIDLAALVDRDAGRARRMALAYGVPTVLSDASQLDSDQIDAAILATPPFHHAPASIDLLQRGIHVLVEKPMATSYEDARRMVDVAERHGVVLAVGFFRRLLPSIRLLRGLVDRHYLGAPQRFEVEGGGMYNWAAATLANMRKDWAGGGVLIDFGSHMLDLMFAVFDEPADLLEYRDNALGGVESDCCLKVRVRHRGQPLEGTVQLARTRNLGSAIRVHCERGTLEFHITERFRVRIAPHGDELRDTVGGAARPYWLEAGWQGQTADESWYETFRRQIDDWIQAIHSGGTPQLSGASALPTARLIEACYENRLPQAEPWVLYDQPRRQPATGVSRGSARAASPGRVLVTGATGFIGSRVAEVLALRDGWDVRAVVHNPGNASRLARLPVEMVQADLRDDAAVQRIVQGCDAVVHCAIGTAWGQRREIFAVTVDGTRKLADAALRAGVRRLIHFSTMSVYGDVSEMRGVLDESRPMRPTRGSEYGESKAEAERVIQRAAARGLSACIFRPARVFGPFSRTFVVNPLSAMKLGGFEWLGSPDVPCDMVYVDNVVESVARALEAEDAAVRGQCFNIGDGDPMTWREFYDRLASPFGLDLGNVPVKPPRFQQRPGRIRSIASLPARAVTGLRAIAASREFKALGWKVLENDPWGVGPRWALGLPGAERVARRIVKADDSLPVYRRDAPAASVRCHMGSGGAVVSIDKARAQLGYEPSVGRAQALELTVQWVRYARLV